MIWDPKWYRAAAAPYTPASRHGARIKYPECFAHVFVTIHVPRVPQNTFVGDGPMIFHRNPLKSHWYSLYNSVRMYSIIWWKFTVFLMFFLAVTHIYTPKIRLTKKDTGFSVFRHSFQKPPKMSFWIQKTKKLELREIRVPNHMDFWLDYGP